MQKFLILSTLVFLPLCTAAQTPLKKLRPPSPRPKAAAAVKPRVKSPAENAAANERSVLEAALSNESTSERIAALEKFIADFSESGERVKAADALARALSALGDEKLAAGDAAGAGETFKKAVAAAPKPFPDGLFSEVISQIPPKLYRRGNAGAAIEIATAIAQAANDNPNQLLVLANFHASTENGDNARRLAERVIELNPTSAAGYIALGYARRLNFEPEAAAAAYGKAVEIDAQSETARRGLADMLRATGKSDEAAALYRELLAKNEKDGQAATGLAMSLFGAGKQQEAEAEMTKALAANPGNVTLLAGAAMWYLSSGDAAKAAELARSAIAAEPRYVWSHIALAEALMRQNNPVEAERVLTAARKFGNFPTLVYEIAKARARAGLYREAAEELSAVFRPADDGISTRLGRRVERTAKSFSELLADERRSSILEPAAVDAPGDGERLRRLLIFSQKLAAGSPADENAIGAAADAFVSGDDAMLVHRQLFAADAMLKANVALDKVLEYTRAATGNTGSGLDAPDAAAAVLASELYESRALAFVRGEYLLVPDVPKQTLSAILRGRVEEIAGWALYGQKNYSDAAIRLRRAVSVYPPKSAWWRSATWRLGAALEADGKDSEALDAYIRSYKIDKPDVVRYGVVENLYKKVKGTLDGLEARIGQNPLQANAAADVSPTATEAPPSVNSSPTAAAAPPPVTLAAPAPKRSDPPPPSRVPIAETKTLQTELPASAPAAAAKLTAENNTSPPAEDAPATDASSSEKATDGDAAAEPVPAAETKSEAVSAPPAVEQPAALKGESISSSPTGGPPAQAAVSENLPAPAPVNRADDVTDSVPTPDANAAAPQKEPAVDTARNEPPAKIAKPAATAATTAPRAARPKPLFEPVIITIPGKPAPAGSDSASDSRPRVVGGSEIRADVPCALTVSDETVSIVAGGGKVGILATVSDAESADAITAVSSSPQNVEIKLDPEAPTADGRRFFIIKSVGETPGLFDVQLASSTCGTATIKVRVR